MDINCDMGEGMQNEAQIMPYIHSANISCGLHAGDERSICETIALAKKYHVKIGAHPSYDDRENFGRVEWELTARQLYELVTGQLETMKEMAARFDEKLHHVKLHGALYNSSARNQFIAAIIATAIRDFDPLLVLYGLSGSFSIREAKAAGLKIAEEGFADRRYNPDGLLVPRTDPKALITEEKEAVEQALSLCEGKILSVTGVSISLHVDTICIHGDGANAVAFAKAIHQAIQ